jgi:hypothetical protein
MITVKFDTSGLDRIIRRLDAIPKAVEQAQLSTLNKAAAQAKTQMQRAITSEYKVSAALVRERLIVKRATRGGSFAFTAALIGNPDSGGRRRSMNLIHFVEKKVTLAEARRRQRAGNQAQLRVQIKKAGGPKVIAGAFIGNQGRTVFERVGKGRLPIRPVQTIGIPQMFSTKKNIGDVTAWIRANLPRIFESELRFYMSRIK